MMNGNGHEFPTTGNPLVDAALKRLNQQYSELQDAMVVQAHLEKRQTEILRAHTEALASHDEFNKQHALKMREFDEKLNALMMWLMRREGLPEAGAQ